MKRATTIRLTSALAVTAALVVTATAMAATIGGRSSGSATNSEAEQIRMSEGALLRATVEGDIAAARQLLAEDFQLVTPLGGLQSREDYLGAVAGGVLDFLVFEPVSAIDVRLYGHAAVIRYRSKIELVAFGERLSHDAWQTKLYEKRQGHWQVVWAQTTAVPNNVALVIEALKPVGH
jgi:hypothetical protein